MYDINIKGLRNMCVDLLEKQMQLYVILDAVIAVLLLANIHRNLYIDLYGCELRNISGKYPNIRRNAYRMTLSNAKYLEITITFL